MANYYLNSDGTITKKKKNENDVKSSGGFGALQEINLPSSNTNKNKNKNVLEQAIDIGKKAINLPTTRMLYDTPANKVKEIKKIYDYGKNAVENTPKVVNQIDMFRRQTPTQKLQTAGMTGLNVMRNIGEGALKTVESGIDAGADIFGGASDIINTKLEKAAGLHKGQTESEVNKKKAETRKQMIAQDTTSALLGLAGDNPETQALYEKRSLVKESNFGGQLSQNIGQQAARLLIGEAAGLNNPKSLTQYIPIGATSYGSGLEEAYNEGATTSEARRYAIGSAATEIITEWATGGIPGVEGSKGGLDKLVEKLMGESLDTTSSSIGKYLFKKGYKLAGEGGEEVLSNAINPFLKQFTYAYNNQKDIFGNISEAWAKENLQSMLDDFIMGAVSAGILEAPSSINEYNNIVNNNRNKEQQSSEIQAKIIPDSIVNNGQINIPTVENNSQNGLNIPINENINTNQNNNINLPTVENTNPLENIEEFKSKQKEIKNQQVQEETNNKIDNLTKQVEELQKSSFNVEENATQYNDLQQTQNIEFMKNPNGDIKVVLKDANGNIVNDFTLISEKQAIKSLGTEIGKHIINSANNQVQNINVAQNQPIYNQPTTFKEQQLDIINKTNPMNDEQHVGIRNVDDIKSFEEAINDDESFSWGDYTKEDALKDLQNGTVMVYSSYPIENGNFVSTSYQQAYEYAGHDKSKVYSKRVPITDVAWINGDEGQYARVNKPIPTARDFNRVNLPSVEKNQNNTINDVLNMTNEEFHNAVKNNTLTAEQHKMVVDYFENAKNNINRDIVLEVAKDLNIIRVHGDVVEQDPYMAQRAGNNVNPKIIEIKEIFDKNIKTKELENKVIDAAMNSYTKNGIGYSTYENIDTQTNFNIRNSGINETFRKSGLRSKADTATILHLIGEQGIYLETSYSSNDVNEIKYHNFLTPVNSVNSEGNAFVRTVIREFPKNNSEKNQFYFHKFEYLDNKKGNTDYGSNNETRTSVLPSMDNDTTTSQKSQISLPTYNMQQNEINIPTKKILNPNEISKITKEDANTTPLLPQVKRNNKNATEESSFYKNATEKSKFLTEESRELLKDEEDIKYYEGISNEESLSRAKERLDKDGQAETLRWFQQDSKKASSTDIAEGWILLKQYQDAEDYESMVEVAKKMREIGTNAGQTVQAFNIMSRLTPEGMVKYAQSELSEAYNVMVKNKSQEWIEKHRDEFDLTPDEVQFIIDNMKEIQNMDDGYDKRVKLAEIQKMMTDKLPAEKGKAIKAWMRISMLFNPKTQVRNVSGNALIMPVNSFGDLFSSYADKIIAKKTGVRTTGKTNIKAILKGMKKGAYEATNDYKKGINTRDMEGNRFEIGEGKSFNDKTAIGKGLNRVDRLLNYVMDAGDRIFSEAAFENSLQNQMVLNNTTEITQDMIDIAHQEALSRTWNDNNEYTKFVLGVRRGLNKIGVNGYGLGDVLIPFAKTPANLTKAIVDYSPAGMIKTIVEGNNLRKSLSNGQYTPQMQHKFVQDLGKATAGTMLYVLGYALAKAGITSGESDDDKDVANFMRNTLGVNSYSVKIGGKTFTYDWAQPLAAPLSITSNIVNKQKEDATLYDSILSSLDTAGNILLEQSFLESLNTALNNNKGIATGIQEAIMELPSRSIPTFAKQLVDLTDGTQRQTFEYNKPLDTAINKVKAKIPGLSQTLAPSVDTMGREIKKQGGKNNLFNVFLNPANVSTENISESAKEIYRLYQETGDTTIMPRVAPYYINKGEKITLNSQQREKYQKISGDIIEKSINDLLKDSKYKNMSDDNKADIINSIVNYAYNKAENEVLGTEISNKYNKINQYINDGGKASNYYLNKEEIDYSYNNPEKYSVIKQIASYDKYNTYKNKITEIRNNTTNDKTETIKYINSLNMSIPQKAMFIKQYYKSFTNYDKDIIKYINNQKLTVKEKEQILTQLGFTVRNGRVY